MFNESLEQKLQHEVRTPLTIILGMSDFLQKSNLTTKQYYCVKGIQESASRLLNALYLFEAAQKDVTDEKD